MNNAFYMDMLRCFVLWSSLLMLAASVVTAYIALYLYGKENGRRGIAAVLLYIPWILFFPFFISAVHWDHWSSIPAVWLASLCAGIPHCFYLKSERKRLKNAAIFGIVSVVCITWMWIGMSSFAFGFLF